MTSKQRKTQPNDKYDLEEYFVYVDLDTKLLDDQLSQSNAKIKFLGIDTENPIMQINNQLFKGSYEYSMGTHCFFTESKRASNAEDACFQELPKKMYDYFAKTNKVLKMKRIFVEEKESEATNSECAEGEIENLEHLRISKTYGEALNQFLKHGEKPPRDIQDSPDSPESNENENETQEVDPALETDQITETLQTDDDPSEECKNTKVIKQAKLETDAICELERLIDTDCEPTRSS